MWILTITMEQLPDKSYSNYKHELDKSWIKAILKIETMFNTNDFAIEVANVGKNLRDTDFLVRRIKNWEIVASLEYQNGY